MRSNKYWKFVASLNQTVQLAKEVNRERLPEDGPALKHLSDCALAVADVAKADLKKTISNVAGAEEVLERLGLKLP